MSEQPEDLAEWLKKGESVILSPHGHSMEPLLKEGKNQVLVRPLDDHPKTGDLLLWWRWDGTYILHRMVGETKERYLLRGDHGTHVNHARKDRVIGVVTDINRGGRWYPVTRFWYRIYVRVWTGIYPLRQRWYLWQRSRKSRSV